MDSVPFSFCLDVLGNLSPYPRGKYQEMANVLTGRWKAAAKRYDDNQIMLSATINCEEGEWGYSTRKVFRVGKIDGKSLDEMLAMDRRYIRFTRIAVNGELERDDSFWTTCSKEEIFSRLIPFLVRQLRPRTTIDFDKGLSRQDARMYFDALLSCKGFRERCSSLNLPYYGPESEQFLATLLEGDCNLQGLSLVLDWPHSETVERLVLQFLGGRPCRLDIYDQSDASPHAVGNLRLNSTILKALFDAWYRKEKFGHFGVCANWDGDLEPVLSIPVPPNVTRTQLKPKKQEDNIFPMPEIKYYILWTREDESALVCVIRSTTVEFTTRQPMIEMFKEYDEMNVTV